MSKAKGVRHGDLCFIYEEDGNPIKLPEGLKKSESKVFMIGSGGNSHSYDNGEFYPIPEKDFYIGYFVAFSNTKLFHKEHGKKTLKGGNKFCELQQRVYKLERQHEQTHKGMVAVVD
ncbi:MAG: hypothetical protein PHH73_00010 [Candidatus Rickettsiella isopodorum]|nr:hypothetical protein [Candidatus Rickettsiella isopodorum]